MQVPSECFVVALCGLYKDSVFCFAYAETLTDG